MAHDVEFVDNRVKVNAAFDDAISAFLLEASAEIVSHAARHSPVDEGHLKGKWAADVNESKAEAIIGNPLEYAIWQELGTGEWAVEGNGRKGGWHYKDDKGEWHFTKGTKPKRMLHNAFVKNKAKIIRRAEQIFKEKLGD